MLLLALSLIALAAQAMTAALAAGRRNMDWVGVCTLGFVAALGGSSLRDVLLAYAAHNEAVRFCLSVLLRVCALGHV